MWQIILPVGFAYFFALLISIFLTFDKLVRLEYTDYRSMWEEDGRPRGFFWGAPETRRWFGIDLRREWAFNRANLVWSFSTPQWMKENPQALRLVRRFRLLTILWNTSFLGIFALIVILASEHSRPYLCRKKDMNNKPLNKNTRLAMIISGGIDALLGSLLLLIGFGLLPIDIAEMGFENWHVLLMGGILFIVGISVIAYNFSRFEE